ncbi:MAG: PIN domain-containing protein [bacterium]
MDKKIIIDTNVVLRYLLKDHQEFYAKSEELFKSAISGKAKLYILQSVVAEVVYVLLKLYKVDKDTIVDTLLKLLSLKGVEVQDYEQTMSALEIFRSRNLDFVDCILCAYSKRYKVFSFDNKLNNCDIK